MNRIEARFQSLKDKGEKALNIFISAGDPDRGKSLEILKALPAAGADMIELGMPFTDPMADGPAIQASSLRALDGGMDLKGTLEMLRQFRTIDQDTPVVLMGYFNPIYAYGVEAFVSDAAHAGADGLLIVDCPPEEDAEIRIPAQKAGLDFIKLLTPTTDEKRLPKVLESASGFLYYVSIAGVTGTKSADKEAIQRHIETIRAHTDLPIAVGFGIKTPEDARSMAAFSDGVVVGSAIVNTIEANQNDPNMTQKVAEQVQAFKSALNS